MLVLLLGLVLFLGVHSSQIFVAGFRRKIIEQRGEGVWKIAYTILSLAGFLLIIWGYGMARIDAPVLYELPLWVRHIALTLMLFAFISFAASTVSGKIAGALKHPQLVAVKIWSIAHLLANGDLASVVLFGSFLVWAIVARLSVKQRVRAGLARDNQGGPLRNDGIAVVAGLGLYVFFVAWAHQFFFGVAPIG